MDDRPNLGDLGPVVVAAAPAPTELAVRQLVDCNSGQEGNGSGGGSDEGFNGTSALLERQAES